MSAGDSLTVRLVCGAVVRHEKKDAAGKPTGASYDQCSAQAIAAELYPAAGGRFDVHARCAKHLNNSPAGELAYLYRAAVKEPRSRRAK